MSILMTRWYPISSLQTYPILRPMEYGRRIIVQARMMSLAMKKDV